MSEEAKHQGTAPAWPFGQTWPEEWPEARARRAEARARALLLEAETALLRAKCDDLEVRINAGR